MKLSERYKLNKSTKVNEICICPSCGSTFKKSCYQQAFCKSKSGTRCKDKYWNTVTPEKRCNTTRISPASAAWSARCEDYNNERFNPDDYEHPFSSEALGQE